MYIYIFIHVYLYIRKMRLSERERGIASERAEMTTRTRESLRLIMLICIFVMM